MLNLYNYCKKIFLQSAERWLKIYNKIYMKRFTYLILFILAIFIIFFTIKFDYVRRSDFPGKEIVKNSFFYIKKNKTRMLNSRNYEVRTQNFKNSYHDTGQFYF